jgi:hypothetical protein
MGQTRDRTAVIDAVLAELRTQIEAELPGEESSPEQIEAAVKRIGGDFQRRLREWIAASRERRSPDWLPDTVGERRALLELKDNWNSYGARSVRPEIVLSAIRLLEGIVQADTPEPVVVPTVRGGVQLEWHRLGADLEIEIDAPGRFQILFGMPEETREEEFEASEADLSRVSSQVARPCPLADPTP